MSNDARVTLACFLAYFVMSGMLSPIGIVLPPLAELLDLSVANAARLFGWLTFGILLGSASALLAFDVLTERSWMRILFGAVVVALVTLRFSDNPWTLRFALGLIGCSCGIGLAAAASVITQLYNQDRRASMLVITDGSFSVAGILVSSLAVASVARDMHWASAYLVVACMALMLVVLASVSRFPRSSVAPPASGTARRSWPLPVWLAVAALFLYTLGQYSLLWWLPSYLESGLGAPRDRAGEVVSRFWTGMLFAQLFVAWWVLRIGARRLVLLSVSGTFLGSLPLWNSDSLAWLPWLAMLWGFANLGLLKVVIAFATLCVAVPTPRLVAALLFGATSGTAVSPAVTSAVVELGGARLALQFGSMCYLILAVLIGFAWYLAYSDPIVETVPVAGERNG